MKIRVSSHGLTRCPGCQAHVQIADSVAATECPFCGTTLGAELRRDPDGPSRLSGLSSAGRSGVLAAALLGGAVACGADPEPVPDPGADSGSDTATDTGSDVGTTDAPMDVGAALYGVPSDVIIDTVPAPDTTPAPEYGIPADVETDAADDVETEVAPDAPPAPEYGVPPDAG